MSSNISMMKRIAVSTAVVVGLSGAFAANGSAQTRAQSFAEQNAEWTRLSEGMPAGSPPVDRSVGPADPVTPAHNQAEEISRFKAMDAQLTLKSEGMPPGSPPVDKTEPAADPIPKATTFAQKESRFAAEDRFLQQMSTQ